MTVSPTILLIASDKAVVSAAAASLGAANYRTVSRDNAGSAAPDLVLRQWDDREGSPDGVAAPVLNVDLAGLGEQELVGLVERVIGFPRGLI
jgi:N-acetylglucosamine kinase-like BadF-type ATPase